MTRIFDTQLFEVFGWAVLHSLWQGALILLGVMAVRRLAGPGRPNLAYLAGVSGLLLAFAGFLATAFILAGGIPDATVPLPADAGTSAPPATLPAGGAGAPAAGAGFEWRVVMPWLGAVWALGFLVLAFQCMYAWARTRCFATIGLRDASPEWTARFAELVARSGVSGDIRLRVSALVESPVTLGTLRPLVLVPAGFLTGFPPAQVEAILLHELAHIRRHDFLVGLVQTAIRTVLYFNPAVRVISRWVDEDREQACDDFAVARTGRPLELAKGLAALRLSLAPAPAMAANSTRGGPLLTRLERLAGRGTQARGLDRVGAAALATALVAATLWGSESYAHPPESDEVRRILVFKDKVPPMPPMPEMPPMPPTPPVPPLPDMSFNPFGEGSTADFEARMEAWGETLGEWGEAYGEKVEESFGDAFETRMEAWGEEMEAWGESIEARGEVFEDLEEMSDAELKAMGLSRADVETAAEAWGLSIAGGVVSGILPGFLADEASGEIAQEMSDLDQGALKRVERALAEHGYETLELAGGSSGWVERQATDPAQKARDEARARADSLRAKLDAERAKRDAERAKRDADRAVRDAKREAERDRMRAERDARRAERDRERAERDALRAEADAFDAGEVGDTLLGMLRRDGIIETDATRYVLKTSPDWTKVNGKRQSDDVHRRYRDYLETENMGPHADLGIELTKDKLELEMRDGGSKTRVTMSR